MYRLNNLQWIKHFPLCPDEYLKFKILNWGARVNKIVADSRIAVKDEGCMSLLKATHHHRA